MNLIDNNQRKKKKQNSKRCHPSRLNYVSGNNTLKTNEKYLQVVACSLVGIKKTVNPKINYKRKIDIFK